MHSAILPDNLRRSSRVPLTLPISVTSLEPAAHFSEVCETLVVNAHGCALRSPSRVEAGLPVHLQFKDGRQATAHIVDCQPIDREAWRIGAKLDRPDNFWGLKPCPEDWMRLLDPFPGNGLPAKMPMLRALVSELVQPLQSEMAELKERLANRNRFEVSLTHIPPEVEEKLGIRLREELGAQILQLARQQSEQVMKEAQSSVAMKISEAQEEFRRRVMAELQGVTQRAQGIADDNAAKVQQHLRAAMSEFQQQVVAAGSRLEKQTQESLQVLQQRMAEEREAQRRELQQAHAAIASETSRLQAQVGEVTGRIGQLDESVRGLESGLHTRLVRMATETVTGARSQLENAANLMFDEAVARNNKALTYQLDEACEKLKTVQGGIETAVSESLRKQINETMQSFRHTIEESAHNSVARWRVALARDLSALTKMLGQDFHAEGEPGHKQG